MTKPTDDDWKAIAKLVDVFIQRTDTEPFREPVDWKTLGLSDYPTIIKQPMDLGTVKKKLQQKKYTTLYQVCNDVRKIWTNCMQYNYEGSDFYNLAASLAKKWDERYTKLLQEQCSSSSADAETTATTKQVSLADRRAFAKSLYTLTKEDLGKLIVEMQGRCAQAIKCNTTEDEIDLNIDAIPGELLVEFQQFVQECQSGSSSTAADGTSAVAAVNPAMASAKKKAASRRKVK